VLPYPSQSREPESAGVLAMRSRDATVAADVNTNSSSSSRRPPCRRCTPTSSRRLDTRRPQVQVECTIVTLDTSDGFSFGVDIGHIKDLGASDFLTLSSFGISTVDPATGNLTPVNAPGGTFALLSPKVADIVLRTLASNSRRASSPRRSCW
jgi:type II secretory pathway component GspD/PulD (secretin)